MTTTIARPRPLSALPLLSVLLLTVLALLLLLFPIVRQDADAAASAVDSSISGSLSLPVTVRTSQTPTVPITANSAPSTPTTTADVFAIDFFSATPSCTPSLASPYCAITCAPYKKLANRSPGCTSSPLTSTSTAGPHWIGVSGSVTGSANIPYFPEYTDTYTATVALLTQGGLNADYYDNAWFLAPTSVSRIDATVNFQWGTGSITTYGVDYVSVRWSGKLKTQYTETHVIYAQADDWVRVWIDRRLVIDAWGAACCNETWATVQLSSSYYHDIIIEYVELRDSAGITLKWSSPQQPKAVIPSSALFSRTAVSGSPYASAFTVTAGVPSATTSYAYDNDTSLVGTTGGLSTAIAGSVRSVLVRPFDEFGNALTIGTDTSTFTPLSLTGPATLTPAIEFLTPSNVYRINYTAATVGTYALNIGLTSTAVSGSPFSVVVSPNVAVALQCTTDLLSPLGPQTVGTALSFHLTLKDANGNTVTTATGADVVTLAGTISGSSTVYVLGTASYAGDGVYHCSWTATAVGSVSLAISVNGVAIGASPIVFNVGIDASKASSSKTTLAGTGLTAATAGVVATFTATVHDLFDNPIPSNLAASYLTSSIVDSTGATVATPAFTFSSPTHTGTYTLTTVGTYTLYVLVNGVNATGSPTTITVRPNVVDATATTLTLLTPLTVLNYVPFVVQLTVRDASGNIVPSPSPAPTASFPCGNTVITRVGNGVYNITVTSHNVGSCQLTCSAGGTTITSSAPSFTVLPGAPSATDSSAALSLSSTTASQSVTLTLTANDASNAAITIGGGLFSAWIAPSTPAWLVALASRSPAYATTNLTVADLSSGSYTASFALTTAGVYHVHAHVLTQGVLLGEYFPFPDLIGTAQTQHDSSIDFSWIADAPISAFPTAYYSVRWTGRLVVPTTATYTFYALVVANTGVRLLLNGVAVINSFNPLQGRTELFGSALLAAGTFHVLQLEHTTQSSGGGLRLMWSSNAGLAKQVVPSSAFYSDDAVSGSPLSLTITPAAVQASASSFTLSTNTFVAGTPFTVTVTLRDQYGNLQTAAAASVTAEFSAPASTTPIASSSGTVSVHTITMTPLVAGTYTLTVKVSSVVIGTVQTLSVSAGAVSPANCKVVNASATLVAGQTGTMYIQAYDANNNLLSYDVTTPSYRFVVTATQGSTTVSASYVYVGAGLYRAQFVLTVATAWTYAVKLNTVTVPIGAVSSVTVSPAAPSGAQSTGAVATGPKTLTLTVNDQYGNARLTGDPAYVTMTTSTGSPPTVTYLVPNAASYVFAYSMLGTGVTYNVVARVARASSASPGVGLGLLGSYYNNRWFQGTPALQRVDATMDFNWGTTDLITPTARSYVSVMWSGYVQCNAGDSIVYTIVSTGTVALTVSGTDLTLTSPSTNTYTSGATTCPAVLGGTAAAHIVPIVLKYSQTTGAASLTLKWAVAAAAAVVIPTASLFPGADDVTGPSAQIVL